MTIWQDAMLLSCLVILIQGLDSLRVGRTWHFRWLSCLLVQQFSCNLSTLLDPISAKLHKIFFVEPSGLSLRLLLLAFNLGRQTLLNTTLTYPAPNFAPPGRTTAAEEKVYRIPRGHLNYCCSSSCRFAALEQFLPDLQITPGRLFSNLAMETHANSNPPRVQAPDSYCPRFLGHHQR